MTGFHTDDVQTLERIRTDRNDNKTEESVAMTNSPRATATTTPTMATNDHGHDWVTTPAADVVVLHLPTAFVLRKTMTSMRTES